jgi:hypothetical protein
MDIDKLLYLYWTKPNPALYTGRTGRPAQSRKNRRVPKKIKTRTKTRNFFTYVGNVKDECYGKDVGKNGKENGGKVGRRRGKMKGLNFSSQRKRKEINGNVL